MQAFFSLTFQSTYEVLALGTAMGLDPATVYSILDDTGASSNIFRATARNVASRQFTGTGNPLSILDKDMKIACQTANTCGLPVPSIAATSANFSKAMEEHETMCGLPFFLLRRRQELKLNSTFHKAAIHHKIKKIRKRGNQPHFRILKNLY